MGESGGHCLCLCHVVVHFVLRVESWMGGGWEGEKTSFAEKEKVFFLKKGNEIFTDRGG